MGRLDLQFTVMPGLDPGIQENKHRASDTWIAGLSPARTRKAEKLYSCRKICSRSTPPSSSRGIARTATSLSGNL